MNTSLFFTEVNANGLNFTTIEHIPESNCKVEARIIINSYYDNLIDESQFNELKSMWLDYFAIDLDKSQFSYFLNDFNYTSSISGHRYFHLDNSVMVDDDFYHESEIGDTIVKDDFNDVYILERNSISVNHSIGGRNVICITHEDYLDEYEYMRNVGYVSNEYIYNNDVVRCTDDDELYYSDDVYFWESDDEYHLTEEPVATINSYNYKPQPIFYKSESEKYETPFYGIELEVENSTKDYHNNDVAEKIKNDEIYFKKDSSISDGFEIVSHPMTFEYIKSNSAKFDFMLDELIKRGFRSYDSSTCGMHIHISKSSFNTWHLYRFMTFFNNNKEFITKLSQREFINLERWASLENNTERDLKYKTKCAKLKRGYFNRYSAINIQNDNTIEIRIFRGTLSKGSFYKNIEFCDSLFNYTRDNSDVTLQGFKDYVNSNKAYKNLSKFIKLKSL